MDTNSRTLNISENLDISNVEIPEVPPDIIYPDELNRFLREQIRYYVYENGMVRKNLSDIELKYNECKTKMNSLETKLKDYEKLSDGTEMVNSTKVASTKIVQLSKKLREKNSEVETLKTKISKLEQSLYELKKKSEDTKETVSLKEEKPANELEEMVKKLQDKLNSTLNKLLEVKDSNSQLKNDLKIANKWLQQEIGESFESLQSLNNSNNGNWRGRAQIICDLQQKNSDLREKLKDVQDRYGNVVPATPSKTDNRVSTLTKENNELKQNYDDLKKKLDASRARCRVLDTDYTVLKSKCTMMKEEAERAQDVISTISAQISNNRDQKNDMIRIRDDAMNDLKKQKDIISKELNEYKIIVKNMKKDLNEKTQELDELRSSQSFNNSSGINNNDKAISRLTAERLKLMELVEVQNNRLKIERDSHSKTHQLLRLEKQRSAKAEANAARIQLESTTARSSSYSTTSIRPLDFGLKDQLELAEENIKALKTRLEIEQYERKSDLQEFAKILQQYEDKK